MESETERRTVAVVFGNYTVSRLCNRADYANLCGVGPLGMEVDFIFISPKTEIVSFLR